MNAVVLWEYLFNQVEPNNLSLNSCQLSCMTNGAIPEASLLPTPQNMKTKMVNQL